MHALDAPQFFGTLAAMLGAAKLGGALAQRIGQPAVLGELVFGILLGPSLLGWVHADQETFHLLSELGVFVLLFAIGLETDLKALIKVGGASSLVAVVGVVLPFLLGFLICRALGLAMIPSIVAGAASTATSVGITARVLSELGHLQARESRIILGAAVLDDILGLIILTVVSQLAAGGEVTVADMLKTTGLAFAFLIATLLLGGLVIPRLFRLLEKFERPGTVTILAVMLALGLAWLADKSGSAVIIGAFAAGTLLAKTGQAREIEHGVTQLGHFFVPIFFVAVGASVDLRALNPVEPAGRSALIVGGLLVVGAIVGKFAAGYAPFWMKVNKPLIGVGMVPRGEVGLIFAQKGLTLGVFDAGLFGAVTLMVMATTFVAPPLLKWLLGREPTAGRPAEEADGIEDLVTEA